jgi:hypothetical protein
LCNKIKENKMDRACGTYEEGRDMCTT